MILLFTFGCENKPPEDITDPGQLLFLGYTKKDVNCARCHGPEGQGGMQGPDIREMFIKYDEDKIIEIIKLGKGQGSEAMPPYEDKMNKEELQALLKYLRTFKAKFSNDS